MMTPRPFSAPARSSSPAPPKSSIATITSAPPLFAFRTAYFSTACTPDYIQSWVLNGGTLAEKPTKKVEYIFAMESRLEISSLPKHAVVFAPTWLTASLNAGFLVPVALHAIRHSRFEQQGHPHKSPSFTRPTPSNKRPLSDILSLETETPSQPSKRRKRESLESALGHLGDCMRLFGEEGSSTPDASFTIPTISTDTKRRTPMGRSSRKGVYTAPAGSTHRKPFFIGSSAVKELPKTRPVGCVELKLEDVFGGEMGEGMVEVEPIGVEREEGRVLLRLKT
ncbi:hypothetical protein SAICODRAFT_18198 [Saitoella complicata NRRL Y-17804]|uniref:BRCT domain-containing protein n=1 Tax=Saitoella complicata (strain BCRC 22490 / CBS 7301 / JCM 7358 / NBRC 10748 / NRRL Y-17804) TaxID=698492 RepID=A0A0E9NHL7_SAICN|nr:uncharacterized protein SAICODRAFT_18198 [Saitoella complicata NRRL Y-17804]ODQ54115.1 hypothetical protein SAICODRAFT_18198 [Saitoella complicata NRRL Y-17804]GAO49186.1 hypothetical protein G7K_3344-t1 [Saitoella complicata NRRL Y-17804]